MAKEEKVELEGEVVEALPNAMFRVKLDNMDRTVLGHVAGKMRRFRIRILPGDRVRVELSPYDLDRARRTSRSAYRRGLRRRTRSRSRRAPASLRQSSASRSPAATSPARRR